MDASLVAGRLYRYFALSLACALAGGLGARLLVRADVGTAWLPLVVAVAAVLPLAVTALRFRGLLATFDELLQRVVLEGFALAFVVFLPLAALYINLRSAGVYVPRLDPPEILVTPALLVLIGLQIAWRRYR